METDDYYRHMDVDAYEMITQYAKISGVDKEHFMTEGGMNMCEAIEEMIEDGRIEGRAEGRLEGRAEGRAESILELLPQNWGRSRSRRENRFCGRPTAKSCADG